MGDTRPHPRAFARAIHPLAAEADASRQNRQRPETAAAERWEGAESMSSTTCQKCGGTGRYLAYRPVLYGTDSAAEWEDARQMAMRPCPDCRDTPDPRLAELIAAAEEVYRLSERSTVHWDRLRAAIAAYREVKP